MKMTMVQRFVSKVLTILTFKPLFLLARRTLLRDPLHTVGPSKAQARPCHPPAAALGGNPPPVHLPFESAAWPLKRVLAACLTGRWKRGGLWALSDELKGTVSRAALSRYSGIFCCNKIVLYHAHLCSSHEALVTIKLWATCSYVSII